MNERLAELESQVKQLYEKLGMSEGVEFEVGDWLIPQDGPPFMYKKGTSKGFCWAGTWAEDLVISNDDGCRKATPDEIETALRKEWERRTKQKGWENPDEAEIEAHADTNNLMINTNDFIVSYYPDEDSLYTKNGCVYHDGNWATLKEKKSEVNPIVVNGYEAEFHEGYVQFGCAKIENSIFEELQEFIDAERPDVAGTIGNKAVTGFRIGEGIFDIETIKAITERING